MIPPGIASVEVQTLIRHGQRVEELVVIGAHGIVRGRYTTVEAMLADVHLDPAELEPDE